MRSHLFPYRTQKLSSSVSKILGWRRPGKIERCRHTKGYSSAGRAAVSKTACREFESLCPCQTKDCASVRSFLLYSQVIDMSAIVIRPFSPEDDLLSISRLFAESWRSAYQGILDPAYLAAIPEDRWVKPLRQERFIFGWPFPGRSWQVFPPVRQQEMKTMSGGARSFLCI